MAEKPKNPVDYDKVFAGLKADGYACTEEDKQVFKETVDKCLAKYNNGQLVGSNVFEYPQNGVYMLFAFIQNLFAKLGFGSGNGLTQDFGDVVEATGAQAKMHQVQFALSEAYAKLHDKGGNLRQLAEAALTTKFNTPGDVIDRPYSVFNQLAPGTGFAANQSTNLETRMAQLDAGELRVQGDLPRKPSTPALTARG